MPHGRHPKVLHGKVFHTRCIFDNCDTHNKVSKVFDVFVTAVNYCFQCERGLDCVQCNQARPVCIVICFCMCLVERVW